MQKRGLQCDVQWSLQIKTQQSSILWQVFFIAKQLLQSLRAHMLPMSVRQCMCCNTDLLHVLIGNCHRGSQGLEEPRIALHIIQITAASQELCHLHATCSIATACFMGAACCCAVQLTGCALG